MARANDSENPPATKWINSVGAWPVYDLPETLSRQDLESVARIHFPSLQDAPLKLVIGAALASDSYPKAVADVVLLARWNAHKRDSKEFHVPML